MGQSILIYANWDQLRSTGLIKFTWVWLWIFLFNIWNMGVPLLVPSIILTIRYQGLLKRNQPYPANLGRFQPVGTTKLARWVQSQHGPSCLHHCPIRGCNESLVHQSTMFSNIFTLSVIFILYILKCLLQSTSNTRNFCAGFIYICWAKS